MRWMRPRGDSVSRRVSRYVGHASRHMPQWMQPRAGSTSKARGAMVMRSTLSGDAAGCEHAVRVEPSLECGLDRRRRSQRAPRPERAAPRRLDALQDQRTTVRLDAGTGRAELVVRSRSEEERVAGT